MPRRSVRLVCALLVSAALVQLAVAQQGVSSGRRGFREDLQTARPSLLAKRHYRIDAVARRAGL